MFFNWIKYGEKKKMLTLCRLDAGEKNNTEDSQLCVAPTRCCESAN